MKIGSVAWGYTPVPEDMPHGDSLERIADKVKKLGFDFIDYLSTEESLEQFFTPQKNRQISDYVRSLGMNVGGLVYQRPCWNSPDDADTDRQFYYFEKCLETACSLGAGIVSCILPGPYGAKPNPRPSPSDKIADRPPAGYTWREDWGRLVSNLNRAADLGAKYGIRIALECFARTLCSTPHAMLRLLEEAQNSNLGIQLDTAHLMAQNIDIETTIYMLGAEHIFHVHAKDADGLTRGNLAPGCGLVDYHAVFHALADVGYAGNVSVEVEFSRNPEEYMKMGLEYLRQVVGI